MEQGQVRYRSRNLPRWVYDALPPVPLQGPGSDC